MKKKNLSEKQLGLFTFIFLALTFVCLIVFSKNTENDSIFLLSFFFVIAFFITGLVFLVKYLIVHIKNTKVKKNNINNITTNTFDENTKTTITQNTNIENKIITESETAPKEKAKPIQRELIKNFNIGTDVFELKYEYDKVFIVGTKHLDEEAQEIVKNLSPNEFIIIDRDSANENDPTAVGVYTMRNGNRILLGYLQKNSHCYNMFNDYLQKGNHVMAVVDINGQATLKLGYYIRKKKEIEKLNNITFTPNSSYNDDAQDSLEDCEQGDECSIEYDYERDKDIICCHSSFIGTIPKKIADIINHCKSYYIFIDSLETIEKDYEDKIKVKLILYYEDYKL